jgi:hypothetical protein
MKSVLALSVAASILTFNTMAANAYEATSGHGDRVPHDNGSSTATLRLPIANRSVLLPADASMTKNETSQPYQEQFNSSQR